MSFRFSMPYLLLAILIFAVEVLIALYVHDDLIRPYFGDVLVVVLIYCFVRSFIQAPVVPVALGVLIFSYLVEMLQYFKVVKLLGLQHSRAANIIIGNYFTWADIICYTIGIGGTILAEKLIALKRSNV
ncbi:ribosomal maturation YjgA family protein [Chitinophaga pinensis]|uniref:DUF2809 domain-containing protein n=1 Tax=Chitinophaga pinensis (strain ATCC 43595 / DSM 2588 / LMG 13176 / NBRC 15968 / NCIMB 11800 / UQM 2034) TaxID=485918 RepID=A0A979GU63_CHIPD|nr:DUF2809 domain-containing protein [Chitinophaga pinensis]ACU59045.1 conserved hypothetical protein [Chitinophaga pinensis DSM 2588]